MKHIPIILLLLVFSALTITSIQKNSGTCDEIAHHIPAGFSYYKKWDFRLNPSNPPLSRYIMALPLNFLNLKAPFDDKSWQEADTSTFGKKLFFEYNKTKTHTILFLSRLMMVFVGILAGLLVYSMAAKIYGYRSGLFALFLFCFTPEVLAHSIFATTDITAACFMLLSIYTFWKFSKYAVMKNIFISGFALGLAQLSKYSAFILYPIFVAIIIIEQILHKKMCFRPFKSVIFIFLISIIIIWSGYGFRMKPFLAEITKNEERIAFVQNLGSRYLPLWDKNLSKKTEYFLKNVPLPLTTYTFGFLGVMKHNKEGHRMFFLGKWSDFGSPLYYLVAFFIKTPIAIILILLLSIFSLFKLKFKKDELYLIVPIVAIVLAASVSKLQLGLRYILPIYPLCVIFASRTITCAKNYWQKSILIILSLWLIFSSLLAWPHYLSYFNETIGGPNNGWKYLRDSNVDWGQDLPALRQYLMKNDIKEIKLFYFGEDNPTAYGITFNKFTDDEFNKPKNRIYAISVEYLDSVNWTKGTESTANAGHSIFIYDFR